MVARLGPGVYLETEEHGCIVLGENVRLNQGTVVVAYDRVEIGARELDAGCVAVLVAAGGGPADRLPR